MIIKTLNKNEYNSRLDYNLILKTYNSILSSDRFKAILDRTLTNQKVSYNDNHLNWSTI